MQNLKYLIILMFLINISCEKEKLNQDTGAAPQVEIVVTQNPAAPEEFTFIAKSTTANVFFWKFGDNVGTAGNDTAKYVYPRAGNYTVSVTATGKGGITTLTQNVTAPALPTVQILLAGSTPTGKTWKYDPKEGLKFGNNFSAQQPCELGTTYTFRPDGTYLVDNKGQEIVFPSCTNKPARPAGRWSVSALSDGKFKLTISAGTFLGDPVTGGDYTISRITRTGFECENVDFGFTRDVKYKFVVN